MSILKMMVTLKDLNSEIIACRRCPRLVEFREKIAGEKRKQFLDWDYWGKAIPGYGSPQARLLIVGLAPAAHGGNRTGRVFTGDKSADFLMDCLYDCGLANQPTSLSRDDGLVLHQAYMTPVLKCVPPGDKPRPEELRHCAPYFQRELELLSDLKILLALGKIAFDAVLRQYRQFYTFKMKDYPFTHYKFHTLPDGKTLVSSYHPSPRNVNTGRLTKSMLVTLLNEIKRLV